MWRPMATIGVWTLASRLLGFGRDVLIAATLGAGPMADALLVALKFPNLFRRLFGEGAFNAAFLPLFAETEARRGPAAARLLASHVAAVMLAGLGSLTLLAIVAMPWLMHGFAPGFGATPARFALAVTLTRITLPYLTLICLAALCAAMLNARDRFAVAAATPILFNLIGIAALLLLARRLPSPAHALAMAVTLAGACQLLWLAAACRRAGLSLRVGWPRLTADVRTLLRRMAPGLLGAGVAQLNLTVGVIVASLLPTGTIAILYYADRLDQLPLGVIGVAAGTALLPALARDLRVGEPAAVARLNQAIGLTLILALPAAAALATIAHPLMTVLFGRGAFTPANVQRGAWALSAYAAGIPAIVLAKLFGPAFFARFDTATPVWIAFASVAANLAVSLALLRPAGLLALPIANTLAASLNAVLLGLVLVRRGYFRPDRALVRHLGRLLAATAAMTVLLLGARLVLTPALLRPGLPRWLALMALVGSGLGAYATAGQWLGCFDVRRLRPANARP